MWSFRDPINLPCAPAFSPHRSMQKLTQLERLDLGSNEFTEVVSTSVGMGLKGPWALASGELAHLERISHCFSSPTKQACSKCCNILLFLKYVPLEPFVKLSCCSVSSLFF